MANVDIRDRRLVQIPDEVLQNAGITRLNLSDNRLSTLPPEIGNLTNLQRLYVGGNRLTTLPPEIGNLTNLQQLELRYNHITSIPPEIGNLTNLRKLDLYSNDLTTLPPEIGNLTNLRELNLHSSHITMLPPEIGNLTNLQKLDLFRNDLTTLPPEIGNLTNLRDLNLSWTRLTTLPPEIGNLTNLRELNLSRTGLTTLPPEINNLTNLRELIIDLPEDADMSIFSEHIIRLINGEEDSSDEDDDSEEEDDDDDDEEEDDSSDDDDDDEMPEGVAYEIHNAFNTFDKALYLEMVQIESAPVVPNIRKYTGIIVQKNEKNRIYSLLMYLVKSKYNGDTPKDELKARIDQIFEERIKGIQLNDTNLKLIQQTLNKLIKSNHIPTINMYLETFTLDCVHAYPFNPVHPGASRMSCAKGVLERFVLNFLSSVKATCCIEDCGVPELRSICAFISLIDFDKNQEVFSTYLQEWAQVEDPSYTTKTAVQRKQSLVDYLTEQYSASAPALAPRYRDKIVNKLDTPGFAEMNFKCNSKDGLFGIDDCVEEEGQPAPVRRYNTRSRARTRGGRKRYTRKYGKRKKTRKPHKSRKRIRSTRRKRNTKKKQLRNTRKPHKTRKSKLSNHRNTRKRRI